MKKIVIFVLILFLLISPVMAAGCYASEVSPTAMVADLVVLRPISIVMTAAGCVVFVAALPFTFWSKDRLASAGEALVVSPAEFTFVRPLGEDL